MPDYPPYEELQAHIDAAVAGLDALADTDNLMFQESVPGRTELVMALRTTLLAVGSSLGECRQAVPFKPMHPVRKNDGTLIWCCTHDPPHPPDCV